MDRSAFDSALREFQNSAAEGDLAPVKSFIENYATGPNERDDDKKAAFYSAATNGHVAVVEYLADYVDAQVRSLALLRACKESGMKEVVACLLEKGANPNFCSAINNFPLGNAALSRQEDVAKLLLEYGADVHFIPPDRKPNVSERSALHTAVYMCDMSMAHLLIENGAEVDTRTSEGVTPLMIAAKDFLGVETVHYLIAKGADINAQDDKGYSSLMHAVTKKRFANAGILIEKGADETLQGKDGKTAGMLMGPENHEEWDNLIRARKTRKCNETVRTLSNGTSAGLKRRPLKVAK